MASTLPVIQASLENNRFLDWRRAAWYAWTMDRMTLHLDILFSSFSKFFQPVLPLAWVDRRWRSDAGALALWSRCDSLHGVEVLRSGASFFYPPAGASAQGSDNTFTPTVRAFREGFHFVIITQQLQREEDACIFDHAQSFEFLAKNIISIKTIMQINK